jgi:outer membrane lipoprotein-sorting protein
MKNWLLFLALILPLHNASAQTSEEKGLSIAQEMDARDTGWVDQRSELTMLLRNKQGQETTRKMRGATLEVVGAGDKSLTIFDTPRDVKGTAFLSHTHAVKPDDQWLFLPALKRVKRISSANKSGPFMGSEFAYEDLTSQEVAKYTYKWLRDEQLGGKSVHVMERIPTYKKSGYTRQVAWVDTVMMQPVKVEYYDRKNALLKTLTASDFAQYLDNRFWRPGTMSMVNHQTGKSTKLTWADYRFGTGLADRDFDRNSLKRAR